VLTGLQGGTYHASDELTGVLSTIGDTIQQRIYVVYIEALDFII
jgi:hypothetical protein